VPTRADAEGGRLEESVVASGGQFEVGQVVWAYSQSLKKYTGGKVPFFPFRIKNLGDADDIEVSHGHAWSDAGATRALRDGRRHRCHSREPQ
jgi:hypothetical protein